MATEVSEEVLEEVAAEVSEGVAAAEVVVVEEPKWKLFLRLSRPDVLTKLEELRIETLSQIEAALENLPVLAAAFRRSESEMKSTFQLLRILVANYGSYVSKYGIIETRSRALYVGYMPPMTEEAFSERIMRRYRESGMVAGGPLGLLAGNGQLLREITPRPDPRLLRMSRCTSSLEETPQVILKADNDFDVDGKLMVYSQCPVGSLRQLVDANHRIPIDTKLQLAREAAKVLAFLHRHGVSPQGNDQLMVMDVLPSLKIQADVMRGKVDATERDMKEDVRALQDLLLRWFNQFDRTRTPVYVLRALEETANDANMLLERLSYERWCARENLQASMAVAETRLHVARSNCAEAETRLQVARSNCAAAESRLEELRRQLVELEASSGSEVSAEGGAK